MRRVVIVVIAVAAAFLGPRFTVPHDRPAGEPFAYEAPEGFTAPVDLTGASPPEKEGERELVHAVTPGHAMNARVTIKRLKKGGNVEPADLATIAEGMPAVLASSGVSWTTIRQETRTRADGARVGLIEGECTKKTDEMPLVGDLTLTYRRLMLVFPTDEGTTLATALYGKDEVALWQPAFEATIGKARGVALRVPPPPGWMHFAWGGAGLVLAWLGMGLLGRNAKAEAKADAKAKAEAKAEEDEEEEE